jgi:hypothetical protein
MIDGLPRARAAIIRAGRDDAVEQGRYEQNGRCMIQFQAPHPGGGGSAS